MKTMILMLLAAAGAFAQSPEERTRAALDQLLAHKYDAFCAQFTPNMKSLITLETFSVQKPSPAEYDKPGHVDEAVIADIARWVQR